MGALEIDAQGSWSGSQKREKRSYASVIKIGTQHLKVTAKAEIKSRSIMSTIFLALQNQDSNIRESTPMKMIKLSPFNLEYIRGDSDPRTG